MFYNRIRVPLTLPAAANRSLILGGASEAGYNAPTSMVGAGQIPYIVTWGVGKYELGVGKYESDGSFTRILVHENDLGNSNLQDITLPATFSIVPTMQGYVANSAVGGTPPRVMAHSSLAVGGNAVAGGAASVAIGMDAAAHAFSSVAIGVGASAPATATGSIAIAPYWPPRSSGEIQIGAYSRRNFFAQTHDASPVIASDRWNQASGIITIAKGELWRIKATVVGAVFDTVSRQPVAAVVRDFSCLAASDGACTPINTVSAETFGTFSGTSSMSVSSGGDVSFTLQGMASTVVDWSISFEFNILVAY